MCGRSSWASPAGADEGIGLASRRLPGSVAVLGGAQRASFGLERTGLRPLRRRRSARLPRTRAPHPAAGVRLGGSGVSLGSLGRRRTTGQAAGDHQRPDNVRAFELECQTPSNSFQCGPTSAHAARNGSDLPGAPGSPEVAPV